MRHPVRKLRREATREVKSKSRTIIALQVDTLADGQLLQEEDGPERPGPFALLLLVTFVASVVFVFGGICGCGGSITRAYLS